MILRLAFRFKEIGHGIYMPFVYWMDLPAIYNRLALQSKLQRWLDFMLRGNDFMMLLRSAEDMVQVFKMINVKLNDLFL